MERLRVSDLMTRDVHTVRPDDDLRVLVMRMDALEVRHMPVVDEDGSLVGLVSQRDLLRRSLLDVEELPVGLQEDLLTRLKVEEVMTAEVESIAPDQDLREAARILFENKYGCLPVIEGARLVGILTESDFVRYFAQQREAEPAPARTQRPASSRRGAARSRTRSR